MIELFKEIKQICSTLDHNFTLGLKKGAKTKTKFHNPFLAIAIFSSFMV